MRHTFLSLSLSLSMESESYYATLTTCYLPDSMKVNLGICDEDDGDANDDDDDDRGYQRLAYHVPCGSSSSNNSNNSNSSVYGSRCRDSSSNKQE